MCLLLDFDVAVAQCAKQPITERFHAGKQFRQSDGEQHVLDQDEAGLLAREPDKPLDAFGNEHQRIDLGPVLSAQFNHHGQGAIGNERERMRRVDRDRRQHGKQPIDEQLPQPNAVVAGQRLMVENGNAFAAQAFL